METLRHDNSLMKSPLNYNDGGIRQAALACGMKGLKDRPFSPHEELALEIVLKERELLQESQAKLAEEYTRTAESQLYTYAELCKLCDISGMIQGTTEPAPWMIASWDQNNDNTFTELDDEARTQAQLSYWHACYCW
jgi:hypothetical protein